MSFVEKNKMWLLPLLGVGIGAVAYLNYRSFAPKPAAEPAAPVAAPAPAAPPPPAPVAVQSNGGVWDDLQGLAQPPANLLEEATLRVTCRGNLGSLLQAPAPLLLPRPGRVREAEPDAVNAPPAVAKVASPPPVPPEVAFIFTGPAGDTAWVHGHPYRAGETVAGGPFRVAAIERTRVGLAGPDGKIIFQTMHPLLPSAGPRPHSEAP